MCQKSDDHMKITDLELHLSIDVDLFLYDLIIHIRYMYIPWGEVLKEQDKC